MLMLPHNRRVSCLSAPCLAPEVNHRTLTSSLSLFFLRSSFLVFFTYQTPTREAGGCVTSAWRTIKEDSTLKPSRDRLCSPNPTITRSSVRALGQFGRPWAPRSVASTQSRHAAPEPQVKTPPRTSTSSRSRAFTVAEHRT